MRRIVLAPSFDDELYGIAAYVQDRFGFSAAEELQARFRKAAGALPELPMIGTLDHGYQTQLYGFVLSPNWVFYRFTDSEIRFLHIRDGRRAKGDQIFDK